jgi:hypothetical protein
VACSDRRQDSASPQVVTFGVFRLVKSLASLQASIRQRGHGAAFPGAGSAPADRTIHADVLLGPHRRPCPTPWCPARAHCQSAVLGGVPDREPDRSLRTTAVAVAAASPAKLVVRSACQLPYSGLGGPAAGRHQRAVYRRPGRLPRARRTWLASRRRSVWRCSANVALKVGCCTLTPPFGPDGAVTDGRGKVPGHTSGQDPRLPPPRTLLIQRSRPHREDNQSPTKSPSAIGGRAVQAQFAGAGGGF